MHSLSTHHYADGGVGSVFHSTKHLSFRGKQRCSQIQYNWSNWWSIFQMSEKHQEKNCLHTAPVGSSKCPEHTPETVPKLSPKGTLGLCVSIATSGSLFLGLKHESNMNVGGYGHLDDTTGAVWRHFMFLFSVVVNIWRIDHQLLQRWLQRCLPLRLQKCFVDSNTSPTPPSA